MVITTYVFVFSVFSNSFYFDLIIYMILILNKNRIFFRKLSEFSEVAFLYNSVFPLISILSWLKLFSLSSPRA